MMKLSWINSMAAVLLVGTAGASDFTHQSDVITVDSTGFYQMVMPTEMLGMTNKDWFDVRLFNANGEEQPYVRRKEQSITVTGAFKAYPIVERNFRRGYASYLVFHNKDKDAIDNLSFVVRNTDVRKRAKLLGSDDGKEWYVIKNDYLLHAMKSQEETTEMKMLNFPLSDYEFYKLQIRDFWEHPIKIEQVGRYDTEKLRGRSTTFQPAQFTQKDSAKTSYLVVDFAGPVYLESISLDLTGAEYYSREVTVKTKRKTISSNHKERVYFETVGKGRLTSNGDSAIALGRLRSDQLLIEISNRDNAPLQVNKLNANYLNQYGVAKLKAGERYRWKLGDESLTKPYYDLQEFRSEIPQRAPKIHSIAFQPIESATAVAAPPHFLQTKTFVWSVIGVVGALIALVSVRMIKDIGQRT